jgi:flagellar biosynthesis/type III secretory pathway chaperone
MGKNAYIDIMIQSLKKKEKVLDGIIKADEVQKQALLDPNLDPDDFDKTVNTKSQLIDELNKLDDGFEETYKLVKEEIEGNRNAYKTEIVELQGLIRKITDKSMQIQRQEASNKQLMSKKFSTVKRQVKEVRQSQKVVNQYYKNMMNRNYVEPQFMDNKK